MKETLEYWNERAILNKDAREITHFDVHQRQFEIDFILKYLNQNQNVLDLGCGNGYTTNKIKNSVKKITGIDFSPEMINRAKTEVGEDENCKFLAGDARNFQLNEKFDVIITQRCLINILDYNKQKEALINIHKHLKSGGLFLMFEGAAEGKKNLNKIRNKFGLENIPKVEYNLDFKESELEDFMKVKFNLKKLITFGQYEYITRIIYPCSIFPENPHYESKFHDIALKAVQNNDDKYPEISKLKFWIWQKK